MDTQVLNNIGEKHDSGLAELVIGGLVMLVSLGLFVYAFQSAAMDGLSAGGSWLIAFSLSAVGIFTWSSGMRKQRRAGETAQRRAHADKAEADAEALAMRAIERARKQ